MDKITRRSESNDAVDKLVKATFIYINFYRRRKLTEKSISFEIYKKSDGKTHRSKICQISARKSEICRNLSSRCLAEHLSNVLTLIDNI